MTERPFTLLTTSRRPTDITRTFCRELSNLLPDTIRMNRGKLSTDEIAEKALELGASKVVIVGRWRGGSGKIQLLTDSSNHTTVTFKLIQRSLRQVC